MHSISSSQALRKLEKVIFEDFYLNAFEDLRLKKIKCSPK